MWLVPISIEKIAAAGFAARQSWNVRFLHGRVKEVNVESSVYDKNHLLNIYVTHNIIAEAQTVIARLTQLTNMVPLQYVDTLWRNELRCQKCTMNIQL